MESVERNRVGLNRAMTAIPSPLYYSLYCWGAPVALLSPLGLVVCSRARPEHGFVPLQEP